MKGYLTPYVTKEIQIKVTMKYCFTSTTMTKIQKADNSKR